MAAKPEAPKCVALVICEGVTEDSRSKNKCILNTFNGIFAATFPCTQDRFTIFATLTDGKGEMPLAFIVKDARGERPDLVRFAGVAHFKDPLGYLDITLDIRQMIFPEPGNYLVEVLIGSESIGIRRFTVTQMVSKPAEGGIGHATD